MRRLRVAYEAVFGLACRWHARTFIGAQDGDTPDLSPYGAGDPRTAALQRTVDYMRAYEGGGCARQCEVVGGTESCFCIVDPQDAAERLGPYEFDRDWPELD